MWFRGINKQVKIVWCGLLRIWAPRVRAWDHPLLAHLCRAVFHTVTALMKPASSSPTGLQWYEVNQPGKANFYADSRGGHLYRRVCGVSPEVASVKSDPLFAWFFSKAFSTHLRKATNASQAGWMLFPRHSGEWTSSEEVFFREPHPPWDSDSLSLLGWCCVLRCEGRHELCICYAIQFCTLLL